MCGIVALLSRSPVDRNLFASMTRSLAHRGPDGEGAIYLAGDRVALGHRRLAILDLTDAGLQPMCDRSERFWITFNGEIFNYRELRDALLAQGYAFKSTTDTEVLIALYEREGMRMLRHLRGMYAFVLHDTRTGETFYARDPIGIKPLYVRKFAGGIAFASEPAILRHLGPTTVDLVPLVRSLMFLYSPGTDFGVREIQRIPPGEAGRIAPDGTHVVIPAGRILPDGRGPTDFTPVPDSATIASSLRASVREHLTSDVPVGIMFSGGLDSSIVAALAAAETSRPVRLFSLYSDQRRADERLDEPANVRAAAESLGLELSPVEPPNGLIAELDRVVNAIGEPVADPAAIATRAIAEQARKEGHYVLLSGHGADELFAGYRRHLVARHIIDRPLLPRLLAAARNLPAGTLSRLGQVFSEERRHWLPLLHSIVRPHDLARLLSPDVTGALSGGGRGGLLGTLLAPFEQAAAPTRGARALRRSMDLDFHTYLVDQNLNYLDKVAMMHGVEGRFPFLTPPLLSDAACLRARDLVQGRQGKVILRDVARKLLPAEMLAYPKRGFGIPLRHLMARDWAGIRDRVAAMNNRSLRLWNPALLRRISDGAEPPADSRSLFTMLSIDSWLLDWAS
jgi:asparagine synthase (glutamine-hydrolysing)